MRREEWGRARHREGVGRDGVGYISLGEEGRGRVWREWQMGEVDLKMVALDRHPTGRLSCLKIALFLCGDQLDIM